MNENNHLPENNILSKPEMNDFQTDQNTEEKYTGDDITGGTGEGVGESLKKERRLHLKAYDYWQHIKAEKRWPFFHELSVDGLAPYRTNSLLIERKTGVSGDASGTVPKSDMTGPIYIRFCGRALEVLFDRRLTVGDNLRDFLNNGFARELVALLDDMEAVGKASEFEYTDSYINSRGTMLPLSRTGPAVDYVWVVVTVKPDDDPDGDIENASEADRPFDGIPAAEDYLEEYTVSNLSLNKAEDESEQALTALLAPARSNAEHYISVQNEGYRGLYTSLAEALTIFERGRTDKAFLDKLLAAEGLKIQRRAPYTPILKLVFGKHYDKTRLTEYATAIKYAVRYGVSADGLVDFLESEPGGIKGCVKRERALNRHHSGTKSYNRLENAKNIVRGLPAQSLKDIQLHQEFGLILARKDQNGQTRIIDHVDPGENSLEALIQALSRKKR